MAAAMAEMTEIRLTRLESDVAHIRSDVADLKTDVRELRKDFGELRNGFAELRGEFGQLRMELRADLGELRTELTRGLLQTRIWMLLLCGAMLGIMAHGLHWIQVEKAASSDSQSSSALGR